MGVSWTKEQLSVIEHRNQNLLVSAAAGSGKTAVLVERILSRILDPKDPVDIDQLLIVTFTRAAAGEMRERIGAALGKALNENPDHEHLQRQQTLLHHAQINTIHGFCSYVIQNYFTLIGLDPAYRMGDEGEMTLMQQDLAAKVLEQAYEEADPEFLHFVECYASGKNDTKLEGMILKLYEFAQSNPWPDQYYESCLSLYEMNLAQLKESPLWESMMQETVRILLDVKNQIQENLHDTEMADGPFWYQPAIQADDLFVEELIQAIAAPETAYETLRQALSAMKLKTLGRAPKKNSASEYLIEQVKKRRDSYKKQLTGLRNEIFFLAEEDLIPSLAACRGPVRQLIRLAQRFGEAYGLEKRRKNILDFSDLEHLALTILAKRDEEGNCIPTPAAEEIASSFREIMIDEYQDSNLIQEVLLSCVAGGGRGEHNRFMVGDIKQSIYGFRLARPELFLEKYHLYRQDEAEGRRIDLAKNFRSRSQVLDVVNYFFRQLMCEALGGISYDADAALYVGASYPEQPVQGANDTEILLVESMENGEEEEAEPVNARTDLEAECYVIARKIRELVGKMDVVDKATGVFRKAEYRDIVILLRTISGWSETFQQVLASMDIPAFASSRTGYFAATEIVTILNYLRICDNPMQDLPLVSVLYSPIGGFSEEELAKIRIREKEADGDFTPEEEKHSFYQTICEYAGLETGELAERLRAFLDKLNSFRAQVPYLPIHRLLEQILDETGYLSYASAMPSGIQRKANLEMLIQKATEYESTSFHGLFHFVRYIEQLQKYEVDYGEVNVNGENTNAVRIMSIHKSKGLEFPIVFVSGMGKQFNLMDTRNALALHAGLGIGVDFIDPALRVKENTLASKVIRRAMAREILAEELRVFYVALTRAKEKLIITGCVKKFAERLAKCSALTGCQSEVLPFSSLTGAAGYMDWILSALARCDAFLPFYEELGFMPDRRPEAFKCPWLPLKISLVRPENLVEEELVRQLELAGEKQKIREAVAGAEGNPVFADQIRERFDYEYPWQNLMHMPVKVSVSELKKAGMEESEEGTPLFHYAKTEKILPSFAREGKEEKLLGAERGTAFHRLLEELDFSKAHTIAGVETQIRTLVDENKMTESQGACISHKAITRLVGSTLGQRMEECQKAGRFHAEQPFVMGVSASLADSKWPEEEQVLVQGIIDVWMEEADGLVLIDYKTDRVTKETKDILVKRYQKQLFYYKMALERLTGKKVKEVWIYSLTIDEAIPLDV